MIIRKSRAEIERMRDAGRILAEVLRNLESIIEIGITTKELDQFAERKICEAGGIPTFKGYRGYPASICASINEEVVHGIPGPRKLRSGDIISIDCGVTYRGFVSDAAITVPVGAVRNEVVELIKATRESLYSAIEKCKIGYRLGDIGNAVQTYVESRGFSVVRSYCGHGIGRSMHEDPQIPNYGEAGKGEKLKEGWVLAIEPMINLGAHDVKVLEDGWTVITLDGRPSAHFEHTIAITAEGPQILTEA